jgi:hypothetical protein
MGGGAGYGNYRAPRIAGMVREATIVLVVLGVILGVIVIASIVLLARNRDGARPSSAAGLPALRSRASLALVQIDSALAEANNEIGFAVAQFGEAKAAEFAAAVAKAQTMTTAAFRLRKELEDAFPETVIKQREMTLQIIAFCETAQQLIDTHESTFSSLRTAEVDAPLKVTELAGRLAETRSRITATSATAKRITTAFRADLGTQHERAIAEATKLLDSAETAITAAKAEISPTGVNAVTSSIVDAENAINRAGALLDTIDATAARYDEAATSLATMIGATTADLAEARKQRDAAPDADTGSAILHAIDAVEKAVATIKATKAPADPVSGLDTLGAALADLDTALAGARNQADRLSHARSALSGALASAKSQITATRGLIGAGGHGVGADARTRLSEAERELQNAQNSADPVEALDAARRAVTNARDADALARYDAMTA